MADNDKVIIQIDADTKEATEKLNALKAKLNEASKAIQERRQGKSSKVPTFRYTEEDGWTPNDRKRSIENIRSKIREQIEKQRQEETIKPETPQDAPERTKGSDKETGLATDNKNAPSDFGKEAGKVFSAVFFAKIAQKGVNLWAVQNRDPLKNNRQTELIQTTASAGIEGALSGGVAGAMLGKTFGPYGALIGGIGGALLGGGGNALASYFTTTKENENQDKLTRYNLGTDRRNFIYQQELTKASVADSMFDRIGMRSSKIEHYNQQMQNLMLGKDGIQKLQTRLESMADGRQNTPQFHRLQQMLAQKQGQYLEYQQKKEMLEIDQPFKKYEATDFNDSYAQQGIFVGNQIDIGSLQQQQIDYVRNILESVREIVSGVNNISQSYLGAWDNTSRDGYISSANK